MWPPGRQAADVRAAQAGRHGTRGACKLLLFQCLRVRQLFISSRVLVRSQSGCLANMNRATHAGQPEPTLVPGLQCDCQLRAAGRAPSLLCDASDSGSGGRLASAQLLCLQIMAKCRLCMLLSTQNAHVVLRCIWGEAVCSAMLNTPAKIRFARRVWAVLQ